MRAVLGTLALLAAANTVALRARLPSQTLDGIRFGRGDAVQNASLVSLGMRRMAADITFIQLLMYYGSSDAELAELEAGVHRDPAGGREHEGHSHESAGPSEYPEVLPRSLRVIDLDPWFSYAALYGAGILAFNLHRPDEALTLLARAVSRDPKQWKYPAYVAAIGFKKEGRPERVLTELTPFLRDPDCPTMLKNMLAFLNRRQGRRAEAIAIYRDILRSRDQDYARLAEKALTELGAAP